MTAPSYRKHVSLPKKQEYIIFGEVQDWLERYVEAESLFGKPPEFDFPAGFPRPVATLNQVEEAAEALRGAWSLGLDPIENLVETLQDRGVRVGLVPGGQDSTP